MTAWVLESNSPGFSGGPTGIRASRVTSRPKPVGKLCVKLSKTTNPCCSYLPTMNNSCSIPGREWLFQWSNGENLSQEMV